MKKERKQLMLNLLKEYRESLTESKVFFQGLQDKTKTWILSRGIEIGKTYIMKRFKSTGFSDPGSKITITSADPRKQRITYLINGKKQNYTNEDFISDIDSFIRCFGDVIRRP